METTEEKPIEKMTLKELRDRADLLSIPDAKVRSRDDLLDLMNNDDAKRRLKRELDANAGFVDISMRPDLRELTHIVNIAGDPNDPNAPALFVALNGFPWQIQRGIDVAVPKLVVERLADTDHVIMFNTGKQDSQGNVLYVKRSTKRISFTSREAGKDEISRVQRASQYKLATEAEMVRMADREQTEVVEEIDPDDSDK